MTGVPPHILASGPLPNVDIARVFNAFGGSGRGGGGGAHASIPTHPLPAHINATVMHAVTRQTFISFKWDH